MNKTVVTVCCCACSGDFYLGDTCTVLLCVWIYWKSSSVLYFWLALELVDITSFQDEDQGLVTWLLTNHSVECV
jgi:hypothetical protein